MSTPALIARATPARITIHGQDDGSRRISCACPCTVAAITIPPGVVFEDALSAVRELHELAVPACPHRRTHAR